MGSPSLASQFAALVGNGLPVFNPFGGAGPLFGYAAFSAGSFLGGVAVSVSWEPGGSGSVCGGDSEFCNWIWAQATPFTAPLPAPGPLPALGAAAAFGFSRKLRKRVKFATAASASNLPLA